MLSLTIVVKVYFTIFQETIRRRTEVQVFQKSMWKATEKSSNRSRSEFGISFKHSVQYVPEMFKFRIPGSTCSI